MKCEREVKGQGKKGGKKREKNCWVSCSTSGFSVIALWLWLHPARWCISQYCQSAGLRKAASCQAKLQLWVLVVVGGGCCLIETLPLRQLAWPASYWACRISCISILSTSPRGLSTWIWGSWCCSTRSKQKRLKAANHRRKFACTGSCRMLRVWHASLRKGRGWYVWDWYVLGPVGFILNSQ